MAAPTKNLTYPSKITTALVGDAATRARAIYMSKKRVTLMASGILVLLSQRTALVMKRLLYESTPQNVKPISAATRARILYASKRRAVVGVMVHEITTTFPPPYQPKPTQRPTFDQLWPRLYRKLT